MKFNYNIQSPIFNLKYLEYQTSCLKIKLFPNENFIFCRRFNKIYLNVNI